MSQYLYHPTPHFVTKMERLGRQDPPGYRRILKVIARLLERPEDADGRMYGLHHGRLKKYVGRRDYRLIYHWCELCRKENRKLENLCGHCHEVQDRSVIFFDIYHKNELDDLRRDGRL
jgi:hypothetical protein